ncbi:Acacb [Acrasis kona]|uniref:Acacb n=1 Tax=Acrasis kona TaxID=1008807 RepID=A0AAW2Z641_9EUKA
MSASERELLRLATGRWDIDNNQGQVSVIFEDNTLSGSINVLNHEGEIADIERIDPRNGKLHLIVEGSYDEEGQDGLLMLKPDRRDRTYIEGEFGIGDDEIEFEATRRRR